MADKQYSAVHNYRIYAMILKAEEKYVFIGRTRGRRLSAVYSKHRTGTVKATEGYFDQDDRPEMYLLEEISVSGSEAYKHVVAWCHIFRKMGYVGINHEGTLSQAEDLLPATRAIVDKLSQEPLDQILLRAYLENPADMDRKPERLNFETVSDRQKETVQVNIRLQRRDKERFEKFCRDVAVNQREGFAVLLDRIHASGEYSGLCALLQERDRKRISLEKENRKLKAKLDSWTANGKSPKELALEQWMGLLYEGINEYLQMLFPDTDRECSLVKMSYRKYVKDKRWKDKPQYPEEEGFLILRLEAILWGNSLHRASFLVGTGEDGCLYKLRCYPKANYVGIPPQASSYAFPGALWYVGYRKSKDGAMDLMASFPLGDENEPIEPEQKDISMNSEIEYKKEPLDSVIQGAYSRIN